MILCPKLVGNLVPSSRGDFPETPSKDIPILGPFWDLFWDPEHPIWDHRYPLITWPKTDIDQMGHLGGGGYFVRAGI